MLATISILSALYKKKDTGEGQHIQLRDAGRYDPTLPDGAVGAISDR